VPADREWWGWVGSGVGAGGGAGLRQKEDTDDDGAEHLEEVSGLGTWRRSVAGDRHG
jgi:hypothetical protein